MCDDRDITGWDKKLAAKGLNRRQFTALTGSAALAACSPDMNRAEGVSTSSGLTENRVLIDMQAGEMDAFFVHPDSGHFPAVILWPDIASLRASTRGMARRLAGEGYAVLAVTPITAMCRVIGSPLRLPFAKRAASIWSSRGANSSHRGRSCAMVMI